MIHNLGITIPVESTVGFRKKLANTLNIAFSQLPEDDGELMELFMRHMEIRISVRDTVDDTDQDFTIFVPGLVPQTQSYHQIIEEEVMNLQVINEDVESE